MKPIIKCLFFIFIVVVQRTTFAQVLIGKSTDDVIEYYKNKHNYILTQLSVPEGVVLPKMKIDHVINMKRTGDSNHTLVRFRNLKDGKQIIYYIEDDSCVEIQFEYPLKKLDAVITELDKKYTRLVNTNGYDESAKIKWVSKDGGGLKVSIINYSTLGYFDVDFQ